MLQKRLAIGCVPHRFFRASYDTAHQIVHFLHQSIQIPTDAIPLHHRELAMVARSRFIHAKHMPQVINIAAACSQQAFHIKLRRGNQTTVKTRTP